MESDRYNRIAATEHGVLTAIEAFLTVARQGMFAANARGDNVGAFMGFVQGVVEHREAFKDQILAQALATLPEEVELAQ